MYIIFVCILFSFSFYSYDPDKGVQIGKTPNINKSRLLRLHNNYREEVKVPPLEWSDELAKKAQLWADSLAYNCTVFESKDAYGENLYWCMGRASESDVVDFWAKERKYFLRQGDKKFIEENAAYYEHYTQMVWKSTTHIGAGCRRCENGDEIWVVFYSPKGNIPGEEVY